MRTLFPARRITDKVSVLRATGGGDWTNGRPPVRVPRQALRNGRASEGVGSLFQITSHPTERLWLKKTPDPLACLSCDANIVSRAPNHGQSVRATGDGWWG